MSSPAVNVHLRSSLVAQEPLKVRSPIYGLFRGLLPPDVASTLADALVPLIEAIESGQVTGLTVQDLRIAITHCHNNGIDVKQFQEAGNPSRLTAAGIAAINLYTGEFVPPQFYSVLNTALRDANREKCKPFVPYIWLLMHALRDCPLYPKKVVFRGVKADLSSQYPKDREVTWFQFSSCTCDLSVEQSEQFCGSSGVRTLFTIELTTGRARLITTYSLVPSEAEVLLPPNCRFKVKGMFNAGNGLIQIQLEELPCLEPILDFDAPVAAAVSGGLAVASHPAVASGGSAATSSPHQAEDSKVIALSKALEALDVGLAAVCLGFAKKLTEEGVLTMDKLKKLPEADAREVLQAAGMKKLQVRTVMEAIAPPPAVVPISPAPSPAPALKPAPHVAAVSSPPAPSAEGLFEEGQRLYEQERYSGAAKSWGQAALLQHGASHAFLSNMLIDGRPDVAKDLKRGFELAAAGAAMGCAHSKGALGRCFIGGYGVAEDVEKGLALGRESAASGSCFGQFVVGRRYYEGLGVAQDYAEAVRLWRLAAAQGHANAQSNLGWMFEYGQGVAKDKAEAIRWYRLAAAQGHAFAQFNLGGMFECGDGVAQDYAEAVRLWRLAAAQGDADAQFNLGVMFEYGRGVAKDKAEAIRWYRLAAAQGHADATAALKRLGA